MHNWSLLLLAFLAAIRTSASFSERSLVDGRQQCCDRQSRSTTYGSYLEKSGQAQGGVVLNKRTKDDPSEYLSASRNSLDRRLIREVKSQFLTSRIVAENRSQRDGRDRAETRSRSDSFRPYTAESVNRIELIGNRRTSEPDVSIRKGSVVRIQVSGDESRYNRDNSNERRIREDTRNQEYFTRNFELYRSSPKIRSKPSEFSRYANVRHESLSQRRDDLFRTSSQRDSRFSREERSLDTLQRYISRQRDTRSRSMEARIPSRDSNQLHSFAEPQSAGLHRLRIANKRDDMIPRTDERTVRTTRNSEGNRLHRESRTREKTSELIGQDTIADSRFPISGFERKSFRSISLDARNEHQILDNERVSSQRFVRSSTENTELRGHASDARGRFIDGRSTHLQRFDRRQPTKSPMETHRFHISINSDLSRTRIIDTRLASLSRVVRQSSEAPMLRVATERDTQRSQNLNTRHVGARRNVDERNSKKGSSVLRTNKRSSSNNRVTERPFSELQRLPVSSESTVRKMDVGDESLRNTNVCQLRSMERNMATSQRLEATHDTRNSQQRRLDRDSRSTTKTRETNGAVLNSRDVRLQLGANERRDSRPATDRLSTHTRNVHVERRASTMARSAESRERYATRDLRENRGFTRSGIRTDEIRRHSQSSRTSSSLQLTRNIGTMRDQRVHVRSFSRNNEINTVVVRNDFQIRDRYQHIRSVDLMNTRDKVHNWDVSAFNAARFNLKLTMKEQENSQFIKESWQAYFFYTLQGIYLCIVLLYILGGKKREKKISRNSTWWNPMTKLIKVD